MEYNDKVKSASIEGPDIKISCLSNVYVRMMTFRKKGLVELGHAHPYDHATMVASGSVEVQVYDEETKKLLPPVVYNAPALIFIKKELVHQITSLEDDTVALCIHALRDENSQIVSPDMIPVPTSLIKTIKIFEDVDVFLEGTASTKNNDELDQHRIQRKFNLSEIF